MINLKGIIGSAKRREHSRRVSASDPLKSNRAGLFEKIKPTVRKPNNEIDSGLMDEAIREGKLTRFDFGGKPIP